MKIPDLTKIKPSKKAFRPELDALLISSKALNASVKTLDEEILWQLLVYELKTRRRAYVALRIYQRANKLRAAREVAVFS